MKKLLIALLMLLPLAGSARMFATQFDVKSVCWSGEDSVEEAIEYHQEILGEYPIGKGWMSDKSFAAIMYNPTKPSWTFLSFHTSGEGVIVCAITGGTQWDIINPGDEAEKLEL